MGSAGQDAVQLEVLEGQLTWLVHIVGAVISGRLSTTTAESQEIIDGDLTARAFGLLQIVDSGYAAQLGMPASFPWLSGTVAPSRRPLVTATQVLETQARSKLMSCMSSTCCMHSHMTYSMHAALHVLVSTMHMLCVLPVCTLESCCV